MNQDHELELAKAAVSFFAQEKHRIAREKRIELIKECVAAILAIVCFVLILGGIYLLVRWIG